jgi:putative addiction module component (TIGR02574 family)
MSKTMEQLTVEASSLPARERATLAERLVEGLVTRPDPAIERAWVVEARRRLDELRSGKAKLIPGGEVSARVNELLREKI